MPTLRKSTGVASIRIRMIGQKKFAAALSYNVELRSADQMLEARYRRPLHQQIVSFRLAPQSRKSRIVDENVRGVRSVRSIFEVGLTAVQKQAPAIGIEEHRRKRVIGVVLDELARRCFQQSSGQRA